MADYPEHEKLQKVQGNTQAIGEFLDWCSEEKKVWLAEWSKLEDPFEDCPDADVMFPIRKDRMDLVAEFYHIDRVALEEEKRAMLRTIREAAS